MLRVQGIGKRLTEDGEIDGGGGLVGGEEDDENRRTTAATQKLSEGKCNVEGGTRRDQLCKELTGEGDRAGGAEAGFGEHDLARWR